MLHHIWSGAGRKRKLLVAALACALVVAVPAAWASHDFTDVPDSSPFHGDISAVKGAGITSGKTCVPPGTPPTYCPAEGITREAMAAFVHRGFGRASGSSGGGATVGGAETDIDVITIDVGGVAGGTQFVVLNAAIGSEIAAPGTGCPCEIAYAILDGDGAVIASGGSFLQNTLDFVGGFNDVGGSAAAVVAVPAATTQTFSLTAVRDAGTGSVFVQGDLTAVTVPFGSTGSSTLATGNRHTASFGR